MRAARDPQSQRKYYKDHDPEGRIYLRPVMTQAEVAEVLGISRGRVFQIEKSALRKLRKRLGIRLGYDD